jgi:hypothetical protein
MATKPGFEPLYDSRNAVQSIAESDLMQTWQKRLRNDNDMIVAIAASSKTEMSGTGKTTLGIQLARHMNESNGPFVADEHGTLSSEAVADELYPNIDHRAPILFDEAQGTANSDGIDNRRAMADAVLNMSRAAATYRYKQIPLVLITQSTRWIDSRMMDIIDRLILIQETNQRASFGRAVVFDHYFDDLSDEKQEYTPAVEDLYWRPLPADDPDYQAMHEMKRQAGDPTTDDTEADEDAPTKSESQQILDAIELHDNHGVPWRKVAEFPGMEFSGEYYRQAAEDCEDSDS